MKKHISILIIGLLLSMSFVVNTVSSEIIETKSIGTTLYVNDNGTADFTKIQDAIDNASDGYTIFVYTGCYKENIVIEKSINLQGEEKYFTTIDGCNKGNTVTIKAENVIFSNFTIINGNVDQIERGSDYFTAGIRVVKSNNIIKNNIIKNNQIGILGLRVTNLSICNNTFYNDCITFSPYENIRRPPIKKEYFLHELKNNTVNGKSLLYLKNMNNLNISSELGQLIAVNCSNLSIRTSISNLSGSGIIMAYCSFCTIKNSQIIKNEGIWTFKSNNNLFQYNNFSNNTLHGITLDYKSNYNTIKNNKIESNEWAGVMIEYYSKYNVITSNNLINNKHNAFIIQSFRNKWYQNYWDDWIGLKFKPFTRLLPKAVIGCPVEKILIIQFPINYDWHPASEPYKI